MLILALSSPGFRLSARAAAPQALSPASCALELSGFDSDGRIRLQTTAYAMDRAGDALAGLSALGAASPHLDRLTLGADPDLRGPDLGQPSLAVTAVVGIDAGANLVRLRAPGLPACHAPVAAASGTRFTGLRDRNGYRSRLFDIRLERIMPIPEEGPLLLLRVEDGAGAESGFVFDAEGRLVGSILARGPHADPALACARPIRANLFETEVVGTDLVSRLAIARRNPSESESPLHAIAAALVLTRPDQADRAIALLDRAAALAGEFPALLLERGVRRFQLGRTDSAVSDFREAARLGPDLYLAHYNLGIALGSIGRYEEAAGSFERAHGVDPEQPRALYHLALAHQAALRPDLARRDHALLEERDPDLALELRTLLGF